MHFGFFHYLCFDYLFHRSIALNKGEDKGILIVSSNLDAVLNLQVSRDVIDAIFYSVVQKQLEQQDDISFKGVRLSLDLLKDAHLYFVGKSAFARIPLDISAATSAMLGSLSIEAVIELDFRLDMSIENHSVLRVGSELTKFRWKKKPELELLKIKFNLNRFLGKLIDDNKRDLEARINTLVSGYDIRQSMLDILPLIEKNISDSWKPLELKHKIIPQQIVIHPESANRKFNDFRIAVTSDVYIDRLDKERVNESGFRASLDKEDNNTARLNTKMLIDALFINSILNEFYREQSFEYQGRSLIVSKPQLSIDRSRINIEASLNGFLNGRLNISFTPILEKEKKALGLSGLSINIKSSGLFDKTKVFLIKNFVLHQIKKKGYIKFEILRNLLQHQISAFIKSKNNNQISSHIHLLDIDIQSLKISSAQIEVKLATEFRNRFKLMPGILDSIL